MCVCVCVCVCVLCLLWGHHDLYGLFGWKPGEIPPNGVHAGSGALPNGSYQSGQAPLLWRCSKHTVVRQDGLAVNPHDDNPQQSVNGVV